MAPAPRTEAAGTGEPPAPTPPPSTRSSGHAKPRPRRGLVGGGWIAWPAGACLLTSCAIALHIGTRTRPELAPFVGGLYACAVFFSLGYALAWKASNPVEQYASLLGTLVIHVFLGWYLFHEAPAGETYRAGVKTSRPPEPGLLFAVALLALSLTLHLVHGLLLGRGTRPAPESRDGNTQ
jgi:hypothetical protein